MFESTTTPAPSLPSDVRRFWRRFPWEKVTIWGIFLFLVYVLRDFFTVIFLTFILSYNITKIVEWAKCRVRKDADRLVLHRLLVLATFVVLLAALYGLGLFLKTPLKQQMRDLRDYMNTMNPHRLLDDVLGNSIGAWRYRREYPREHGNEAFDRDFETFQREQATDAPQAFQAWEQQVRAQFDRSEEERLGRAKYDDLQRVGNNMARLLRDWIVLHRAPERLAALTPEERHERERRWEESYSSLYGQTADEQQSDENPPLDALAKDKQRFEQMRSTWILNQLAGEEIARAPETSRAAYQASLGVVAYEEQRNSGDAEQNYRRYLAERPRAASEPQYDVLRIIRLRDACRRSPAAFLAELNPDEARESAIEAFRRTSKKELARRSLEDWPFLQDVINGSEKQIAEWIPTLAEKLTQWTLNFFKLTMWVVLSLLLSFFITMDLPRLRRGIQSLEKSRLSGFYREIAPGLLAFGALIGRAFQAQGVIALCNAVLTLLLIKLLGIRYETFLCTIVFFCSFIPVLGVVLSTVPIALIAFQYNSITTALLGIAGVVLIHFIESSILNPKILGDMLHLHPVLVLVILVVAEHFFGVWGLLLGMPVVVYIIRHLIFGNPSSAQAAPVHT
ncbi:MAG: AI-2E family transporter [Planctomycetes bacterium]|nr:AI-2E family transporter [Planctomycetota bacterium]